MILILLLFFIDAKSGNRQMSKQGHNGQSASTGMSPKTTIKDAMRAYTLSYQLQSRQQLLSAQQKKTIKASYVVYMPHVERINKTIYDLYTESIAAKDLINSLYSLKTFGKENYDLVEKAKKTIFKNNLLIIMNFQKMAYIFSETKDSNFTSAVNSIQKWCKDITLEISNNYMTFSLTENRTLIPNLRRKCKLVIKILGKPNQYFRPRIIDDLIKQMRNTLRNIKSLRTAPVPHKILKQYIDKADQIIAKTPSEWTTIERNQFQHAKILLKRAQKQSKTKLEKFDSMPDEVRNITSNKRQLLRELRHKKFILTKLVLYGENTTQNIEDISKVKKQISKISQTDPKTMKKLKKLTIEKPTNKTSSAQDKKTLIKIDEKVMKKKNKPIKKTKVTIKKHIPPERTSRNRQTTRRNSYLSQSENNDSPYESDQQDFSSSTQQD